MHRTSSGASVALALLVLSCNFATPERDVQRQVGSSARETVQPTREEAKGPTLGALTEGEILFADAECKEEPLYRIDSSSAQVVERVEPVFPKGGLQPDWRGETRLDVRVNPEGRVCEIRLVSGGPFKFEKIYAEAVQQWRFRPFIRDGQAVAVAFELSILFNPVGS